MPELKLPPLHQPEVGYYLLAVMLAPDDETAQRDFVAAAHAVPVQRILRRLAADRDGWSRSPEAVRHIAELGIELASAPQWDDVAGRLAPQGVKGGHFACRTLVMVLSCAEHAPEHASLGALYRYWKRLLDEHRLPGGSRAKLKAQWRRFAPVAHLWAALEFAHELWEEAAQTGNGSKVAEWLALAERLRRKGEDFVPYRGHEPLLNPAKTWKVPDRFILPPVEQELPLPSRDDLTRIGLLSH